MQLSGYTRASSRNGIFSFEDIKVKGEPGTNNTLIVRSSSIANSAYHLEIPIAFRQCIPGEVNQNNECVKCGKGFFSLDP